MSHADAIEAAGRKRGERGRDKEPRRRVTMATALKAASQAGYGRVRMTVDNDGKITLDMGQAGDLPPDTKGEPSPWDKLLDKDE
jgi:hypothetical protein